MTKAAATIKTTDGMQIAIPVGSFDKPSEQSEATMKAMQDSRGWKYPIKPHPTFDAGEANDLAYCYNYYCGGHEIEITNTSNGPLYIVSSKGYYHYIGA